MDTMLIAIFDTAPQALKGLIELRFLHRAGDITLYATAVIAKDSSGKVSIKQASERELNEAPLGLLTGILLGTLGGPIGLAMGGFIGGLAGLIFDLAKAGISADFLEKASQALPPGKAALLAEVDETLEAPVDMKLMKLCGHVYRRSRSEFVEEQLLDELDAINVELS
jgi:uncharacterized membrane protein